MTFPCRRNCINALFFAASLSMLATTFSVTEAVSYDWRTSVAEGDRRMVTQELGTAEDQYRQAVKDVRRSGASGDDVSLCLEKLAGVLQIEDQTQDVIPLYKRSLKLLEKAHGAESMKLVPTLVALGIVFEGESDYRKAADYYSRAASITEKSLGRASLLYAEKEHLVGRALFKAGSYSEAEAMYMKSLTIIMQQSTLTSTNVLEDVLADYSQLLMKTNAQTRILSSNFQTELLKDKVGAHGRTKGVALSAWDKRVSGKLSDDIAGSPKRVIDGTVISSTREQGFEPAKDRKSYEAPAPGIGSITMNHVPSDIVTLDQINKQRIEFYERMIAADIDSLGANHPSVARDLSGLSAIYLTQKKCEEARPLLTKALAIYKSTYGVDAGVVARTQALLNLASQERSTGTVTLDDSYMNSLPAVAVQSQKLEIALRFNYMALQCFSQHKIDDALKLYSWALATTVKAFGQRSTLVASCLTDYGRVLRSCGRKSEAELFEKSAQSILMLALEKQATAVFP